MHAFEEIDCKIGVTLFRPQSLNHSGAETGIFRENWTYNMVADVLAPPVTRPAAAMALNAEDMQVFQSPLLPTWINFKPSMDK